MPTNESASDTARPWLGPPRTYAVVAIATVAVLTEAYLLSRIPNNIYGEGFAGSLLAISAIAIFWFIGLKLTGWVAVQAERLTAKRSRPIRVGSRLILASVLTLLAVIYLTSWGAYFRTERFANVDAFQFIFQNPPQTMWLYMGPGERTAVVAIGIAGLIAIPLLALGIRWIGNQKQTVAPIAPKLSEDTWCRVVALTFLAGLFFVVSDSNPVQKGLRTAALQNGMNPFVTLSVAAFDRINTEPIPDCLVASDLRPIRTWTPPEETKANHPSVIFIAVESLRADVVNKQHQGIEITPNLNRLVRKSVNFTRAYSQSTHSDYADVCIVSSLYPLRTREHHFYKRNDPWPRTTAFDAFKQAGYRTAIISSQNESWGGMDRFLETPNLDLFYDAKRYAQNHANDSAEELELGDCDFGCFGCLPDRHTMDKAIHWVSETAWSGKPFFLSMNFQSSHFPYELPTEAAKPFQPCHLDSDVTFMDYPVEKRESVRNAYFNAIRYCDLQLGRMVQSLDELNILDDVVLVVLGENGEAFHENGSIGHGQNPVEPAVHVAAAIHAPKYLKPRTDDYPVELIDLLPTVFGMLDWPEHPNFQGIDVLADSRPAIDERLLFFHTNTAVSLADAVQFAGRWKYLQDHLNGRGVLFDLQNDPGERTDVTAQHPALASRLKRVLKQWRDRQLAYYRHAKHYESSYPPRAPRLETPTSTSSAIPAIALPASVK